MRVFVLLPVKLSGAKTRLSNIFSGEDRAELAFCMLEDVLDSLKGLEVVVISPDDLRKKLDYDFHFIHEKKKRGLNSAVEQANSYAIDSGADATLFVPADTPLIKKSHVKEILRLGKKHKLIISPSRRGGTGILFRRPPDIIRGRFTNTSFEDHRKEAALQGVKMHVYDSFSLSLDIDAPEDVQEFLLHGKGTKTYEFLISRYPFQLPPHKNI
ncbi:MAG: 2-phospho-L-lactate guanylyltransferase [Euryarchaeota archaeon]|nr:2-phospho-L-lactate guanylyltransferase [Euryarchaeota archaeon]